MQIWDAAQVKEVPMTRQITRYDPMVTDARHAKAIDGTRLRVQLCGIDRGPA
jgi:hypothetical protein